MKKWIGLSFIILTLVIFIVSLCLLIIKGQEAQYAIIPVIVTLLALSALCYNGRNWRWWH